MNSSVDVLVIGAGAAGTAAALQFGRARRSVAVVDGGSPRNAPAAHMQGYPGHDGLPPADFQAITHAELAEYGVSVTSGRITGVAELDHRLECTTDTGDTIVARRVVVATGLTDVLPDIDGLRELWGDQVIHCPWCHGWEVRDQRIVVLNASPFGSHQALMFAQLSDHVTIVRAGHDALSDDERERLGLAGVTIDERTVRSVAEVDGEVHVAFDDDTELAADVAAIAPRFDANVHAVEGLVEVADHMSGMGRHVVTDEFGATSHPLVFAVGNVTDPMQQVLHAAAHGSRVAAMIHGGPGGLIDDDLDAARRSSSARARWDERYGDHDEAMWSGRPNGSLVTVTEQLTPGRALDIGCGEGADVIWLAGQGWEASGVDISPVAIERARAAGTATGTDVQFAATDVLTEPPEPAAFDLVAISYPAFDRSAGLTGFGSVAAAVAPGGRLLVIGHVQDADFHAHALERGFDPADFLSIDDMIGLLDDSFTIDTDDERDRPDVPAGNVHRLDRVLVARRTA